MSESTIELGGGLALFVFISVFSLLNTAPKRWFLKSRGNLVSWEVGENSLE